MFTIRSIQINMLRLPKSLCRTNSQNFTTRYNEHKRAFRNNSHSSKFAQHLNENTHSFGTINNNMQVLQFQKKGSHHSTTERFYIHREAVSNNHLNDSHTVFPNRIFDTILKTYQPLLTPPLLPYHIPHPDQYPISLTHDTTSAQRYQPSSTNKRIHTPSPSTYSRK
jgi:hypothetical protein